jgi:hypothetical protein
MSTRDQLIEQMVAAAHDARCRFHTEQGELLGHTGFVMSTERDAEDMLTVAVKAVTDRVRDAIDEVVFDLSFDDRTRVVAVDDLLPALDRIDAELGGE